MVQAMVDRITLSAVGGLELRLLFGSNAAAAPGRGKGPGFLKPGPFSAPRRPPHGQRARAG